MSSNTLKSLYDYFLSLSPDCKSMTTGTISASAHLCGLSISLVTAELMDERTDRLTVSSVTMTDD